jgi:predicted alpha/beta-hydrolase family hydrolase
MVRTAAVATRPWRRDPTTSVTEEAGFDGDRFFVLHLPPTPRLALVVCSPLHGEMQRNYRREVLLSRRLAAAGTAVERFHYRGTGNSAGEPARLALETMIEDGIAAVRHLQERAGEVPVAVLGTRVGGLVAAAVAAEEKASGLALWQPLVKGSSYLREAERAAMARVITNTGGERPPPLHDILAAHGSADLLGERLYATLAASLETAQLSTLIGSQPRPVLLAQAGGPDGLRGELARLADELGTKGFDVTSRPTGDAEVWWANPGGDLFREEDAKPLTVELLRITSDWVETLS